MHDRLHPSTHRLRLFDFAWRQRAHFRSLFAVNTPDDMARLAIGGRYVTSEAIENWKTAHGYDLPLVYNDEAQGIEKITKTVFTRDRLRF